MILSGTSRLVLEAASGKEKEAELTVGFNYPEIIVIISCPSSVQVRCRQLIGQTWSTEESSHLRPCCSLIWPPYPFSWHQRASHIALTSGQQFSQRPPRSAPDPRPSCFSCLPGSSAKAPCFLTKQLSACLWVSQADLVAKVPKGKGWASVSPSALAEKWNTEFFSKQRVRVR